MRRLITLFVVSLSFLFGFAKAADPTVVVSAGAFDRRQTPVAFDAPNLKSGAAYELVDDKGAITPVQVDAASHGWLVLKELGKEQTISYQLRAANPRAAATPDLNRATTKEGQVIITVGGKEVLRYQAEKKPAPASFGPEYTRGGYIWPIYTPGGLLVADDYPPQHKHHHGIWNPWTATRFEDRKPDFWNMGQKSGTVEPAALDATWSGPVFAGWTARHRFMDLSATPPKAALDETWTVKVFGVNDDCRLFDWQSVQSTAGDAPLVLPKYHYGGLGFRGHRDWDGKDNARFITSEGKTRKDGNETTARWVQIAGNVDGKPATVTILCAPDNFRFPQPVRIHPTEPFVCYAPQQAGEFKIEKGTPYTAKYRFAVTDGDLNKAEAERLWNDYAHPPTAVVK